MTTTDCLEPITHVGLGHLKKSALQEILNTAGPDKAAALIKKSLQSAPDSF